MPKTLIVNNTPYSYPTAGDAPGWGNDATNWASGVTDVLSDLLGPNDILETAFNIANGVSTQSVTGLVFNAAAVRSAKIDYAIYRVSDVETSGNTESGVLNIVYDNVAGWLISHGSITGDAGVTFTITPTGQIQYSSTTLAGTVYSGTMKFRAKALNQ